MRDFTRRQAKGKIKRLAKQLIPGVTYAMGCRGHPGLVIERCYHHTWSTSDLYGADVTIKSLVDGVEENCSLFYCYPEPINRTEATSLAEKIKTVNAFDLAIERGYPLDETIQWLLDWLDRGVLYSVVYTNDEGCSVESTSAFTQQDAQNEVDSMHKRRVESGMKYIDPRIVSILEYPSPIRHPELARIVLEYTPKIEVSPELDKSLRSAIRASSTLVEVL